MSILEGDRAGEHYMQAKRYGNPRKRAFDPALAIEHLKEAVRLRPDNARYQFELGKAYLLTPELAIIYGVDVPFKLTESAGMAVSQLRDATRLKPRHSDAYYHLSVAYMDLGERGKAAEAMTTLTLIRNNLRSLINPASGAGRLWGQTVLRQLAIGDSDPDKRDEVRRHLEEAVSHRDKGEHHQAKKELNKAVGFLYDRGWGWLYQQMCELGER